MIKIRLFDKELKKSKITFLMFVGASNSAA